MDNLWTGMAAAMRMIIDDADDSMTSRQIAHALQTQGVAFTRDSLRKHLRRRHGVGELVRNEINGQLSYTLNPEFVPSKKGRKLKTGNVKVALRTAAAIAAHVEKLPIADLPAAVARVDAVPHLPRHALGPMATLTSGPVAVGQALPPIDAVPHLQRWTSLGLRERIDAIANDIDDAIGDACDAQLCHGLIKALVLAGGATHRALQKMADES